VSAALDDFAGLPAVDGIRGLGGSDATRIMKGDLVRLYDEKTGAVTPEDLSGVLRVQMGLATEALNLRWLSKAMDSLVIRCGGIPAINSSHSFEHIAAGFSRQVEFSPDRNAPEYYETTVIDHADVWRLCRPDALIVGDDGNWWLAEAKHTNPYTGKDKAAFVQSYYPQVQHNLAVTGLPACVLSVFVGNSDHWWEVVYADADYQDRLYLAELEFWTRVVERRRPSGMAADMAAEDTAVARTEVKTRRIERDMTGNNEWATAAVSWLDDGPAAKRHAKAVEKLKAIVNETTADQDGNPAVVAHAFGHGIEITRDAKGALRIKEAP